MWLLFPLLVIGLVVLLAAWKAQKRRYQPGTPVQYREDDGRTRRGRVVHASGDYVVVRWDSGGELEVPRSRLL